MNDAQPIILQTSTDRRDSNYLYLSEELSSITELADALDRAAANEQFKRGEELVAFVERIAKELVPSVFQLLSSYCLSLSCEVQRTSRELRTDLVDELSKLMASELAQLKHESKVALKEKIGRTLQSLPWNSRARISVNPSQRDSLKDDTDLTDENIEVCADSNIAKGEFRIDIGKTSMHYNISKDVARITESFFQRAGRGMC